MKEKTTLYLVDGSSYIYRAFYGIRGLKAPDGVPTNAVLGFLNTLLKVIREKGPTLLAVAYDSKGPTFRHESFPEYKATRDRMPEDLAVQLPLIREGVELLGIPSLELAGYEADDLIATAARWASDQGFDVVILSGDKDLMQLIGPGVTMLDAPKDKVIDEAAVKDRFGVGPAALPELFGMLGDSSDNLPGVPGIGPKKAAELVARFGTLERIIESSDEIEPTRFKSAMKKGADLALITKKLFLLDRDAPIELSLEGLSLREPESKGLAAFLERLALKKLLDELGLGARAARLADVEVRRATDPAALLAEIGPKIVSIAPVFEGEGARGLALAFEPGSAVLSGEIGTELAGFLEDPGKPIAGHDLKSIGLVLAAQDITLSGFAFDTKVAAYLLDPGGGGLSLSALVKARFGEDLKDPEGEPGEAAATRRADAVLRLMPVLGKELEDHGMSPLFTEMEMCLVGVLFNMEKRGVMVDSGMLLDISRDFEAHLKESEAFIHKLADVEFNINSPKQLAEVLFDKLKLPVVKKTKTGPSTDIRVLSALAPLHPLPQEIIHYRTLAKLKSTYLDALPRLINPSTGRIHTSYNQTVTATGRLSSSNPNLQNIPVRAEEGRMIREAFVAEEGSVLVSADYSQIELRILAHYSGDPVLLGAFEKGEDVHQATAQRVFHVSSGGVTPEMRRKAKVINFGIIYGMGPKKLSGELAISMKEAKKIIDLYFMRFPGIKSYFEDAVHAARSLGYAQTLFGRRRLLPNISSMSRMARSAAERMAVNTPIQGSAADIIKRAMITLEEELAALRAGFGMIMQVHDELVLEVKEATAEDAARLAKEVMEDAAALKVPLVVDVGIGNNWSQAH